MIYVILLQCVSTLVYANMEISSYCVGVADRCDITYWQILDYFYIWVSKSWDKIRKNYCRNALNWPKIYIFAYTKTNTIILIEMCVLLPYSPFVNLLKTYRGGYFVHYQVVTRVNQATLNFLIFPHRLSRIRGGMYSFCLCP